MIHARGVVMATVALCAWLALAGRAQAGLITFENLSNLEAVTTQYQAQGVVFLGATVLQDPNYNTYNYPPHSGFNVIYSPSTGLGVIRINAFGGLWSEASVYVRGTSIIYLEAFAANDEPLGATHTP